MKNPTNKSVAPAIGWQTPEWVNMQNAGILISALTFLVYLPALSNDFVWDDTPYVLQNPYFEDILSAFKIDSYHMGNYHPLTLVTLYLDNLIGGENPFIYHLHNIIIHILATLLTGILILRYSKSMMTASLAALLYGVHPIHVESVAWISERKDVLYGFWFFASLLSWDEFRKGGDRRYQLLAGFTFILSCMAKGMAVTLPIVIALLDLLHYRKSIKTIIIDTAGGFMIALAFGLIAIKAQKDSAALREGEYYQVIDHTVIGLTGWFLYLSKLLAPYPLSAMYTLPLKNPDSMRFDNIFYICAGLFLFIPLIVWKVNNRARLWILGFTASVIHVLFAPVGSAMAADRYMYVPSFFFVWALAELILYGIKPGNTLKKSGSILMLVVIGIMGGLTFQRTRVWETNFTLFSDVARQYPHDLLANNNIGLHYLKLKEYDKARVAYSRVIKHYPMDYTGYFNMASSYIQEEKGREALDYLHRVEQLNPGYKDLYPQMGIAALYAKVNDTAAYAMERSLQLQPNNIDLVFNLALAYSRLGRYQASDSVYKKGLGMDATRSNAYMYLAYNANRSGRYSEEQMYMEKAKAGGEDEGYLLRNIGIMIGETEDYEGAKVFFERALALDEKDGEAWFNLALSWEKTGRLEVAIPMYQTSARNGFQAAIDLLKKNNMEY